MFQDKGFTLIEVIIAIALITTGILGVFKVIPFITSYTSLSGTRLTAGYLAQEGIEIVRNIRDGNYLEGSSWSEGLASGDWEADYNDLSLSSWNDRFLNIESGGFYGYGAGTASRFKRKITITPQGSDILEVSIRVSWQFRGETKTVVVQENLYNWQW